MDARQVAGVGELPREADGGVEASFELVSQARRGSVHAAHAVDRDLLDQQFFLDELLVGIGRRRGRALAPLGNRCSPMVLMPLRRSPGEVERGMGASPGIGRRIVGTEVEYGLYAPVRPPRPSPSASPPQSRTCSSVVRAISAAIYPTAGGCTSTSAPTPSTPLPSAPRWPTRSPTSSPARRSSPTWSRQAAADGIIPRGPPEQARRRLRRARVGCPRELPRAAHRHRGRARAGPRPAPRHPDRLGGSRPGAPRPRATGAARDSSWGRRRGTSARSPARPASTTGPWCPPGTSPTPTAGGGGECTSPAPTPTWRRGRSGCGWARRRSCCA